MGGVEPLFDYGADHHHVQMQHFDDDDDDEGDDDRNGLNGKGGQRSQHGQGQGQYHDVNDDAEANQRWRSGEPSRGPLIDGGQVRGGQ